MGVERRLAMRTAFRCGYLPPAARIRPGREVVVVDLSNGGALVEGPWRFRPGARCEVHIGGGETSVSVRARIVRCYVARLDWQSPVRYRTALAFERPLALRQRLERLEGYLLPGFRTTANAGGVGDTRRLPMETSE
jgi:hypothetical protein